MDTRILPDVLVYLEVVRSGSLTRAAERLHTVQPNVTARIKKLEEALGASLLKRHARGIKPTPAGEAALAVALRLESVLENLRFTFGKGRKEHHAKLRVGAIETVVAAQLPTLVSTFLREHPQVNVSIHTGSSSALLKQIKDGELDVALVSRAPGIPGLREHLAFVDELVMVAPPGTRDSSVLLTQAGSTLKILVQRLGCSYTERMVEALKTLAPRRYEFMELGTLEGILGFVELGLGIAAMPRSFVSSLATSRNLSLIALPLNVRKLRTYIVAPSAVDSFGAINAFVEASLRKTEPRRPLNRKAVET